MSYLKRPFPLGGIELPSNVFCAPLAGCSDLPFRKMTHSFRPGLFFCEMVKIDALVRHDSHTMRYLSYTPDMHPIGAQICGSKSQMAAEAARIIEDLGFDVIDLNCGCPVDKVTKDGSGSALLRNPDLIGEILHAVAAAVRIPVTVKIRAGWDDRQINAAAITRIAEESGAVAITVHGRTREQGYQGAANWDHIRDCKAAARRILVIGNGDVFDAESAERMFAHTQCDGILIGRGALGRPWILEDIYRRLSGEPAVHRTVQDVRRTLLDHFHNISQYQCDRQALLDIRRVGCWYLRPCIGAKALRVQLNQSASLQQALQALDGFDWGSMKLKEEIHAANDV
jgi:tRNA-dihydrouridine synthase B